jgi:aryl-alcohol dehydrogenase-like predicted oxidoreductase
MRSDFSGAEPVLGSQSSLWAAHCSALPGAMGPSLAKHDEFIVASKYTFGAHVLRTGNNRKNMVRSIEASLKRLKTDRIDLYWVHLDDGVTRMEEIVRGLDDLVRTGKIL